MDKETFVDFIEDYKYWFNEKELNELISKDKNENIYQKFNEIDKLEEIKRHLQNDEITKAFTKINFLIKKIIKEM